MRANERDEHGIRQRQRRLAFWPLMRIQNTLRLTEGERPIEIAEMALSVREWGRDGRKRDGAKTTGTTSATQKEKKKLADVELSEWIFCAASTFQRKVYLCFMKWFLFFALNQKMSKSKQKTNSMAFPIAHRVSSCAVYLSKVFKVYRPNVKRSERLPLARTDTQRWQTYAMHIKPLDRSICST